MRKSIKKLDGSDWISDPELVRRKLIEAASTLFAKKSFSSTSLQEISELSGVTRTLIRHYLKSESDIMRMIMEDLLISFQKALFDMTHENDDPESKLADAFKVYVRTLDVQKEKVLIVYQASKFLDKSDRSEIMHLEVEVSTLFSEIIAEGIEKGRFKEVNKDVMAYNIIMLAHSWVLKNWHFKRFLNVNQFIDIQQETILDMLKK